MTTRAPAPAIVILGDGSLATARRIRAALPGAEIHGLAGRVSGADRSFEEFGATLRTLLADDVPIVALCAAGIVIRALAPVLQNKRAEPPVLAVAEDGSAVVPLLGGLRGVNALARTIGAALGTAAAITTTGEIRFGATLEHPPAGYTLRDPGAAKRFMSDLLAGARVRLSGAAPWLADSALPWDPAGTLAVTVTPRDRAAAPNELVIHPHTVALGVVAGDPALPARAIATLARAGLSPCAVALVVAAERDAAAAEIHALATQLDRPLRLVAATADSAALAALAVPAPAEDPIVDGALALAVAPAPIDPATVGRARGRLTVVGLGPGAAGWLAPAARAALADAEDIVGYQTYVALAEPFRGDQTLHVSDNREELQRARQALSLAARGRRVAVVSSGDPGIFAMAAAVMEALDGAPDDAAPAWHGVALAVVPGISAAQAAAARAGAPLGHDFCVLSLSDNLKPWAVIERRLALAASGDFVLALYNPASQARPHQLARALEIIRAHRAPGTPVVIGRDVGRTDESVRIVTLGELSPDGIDMRTVLIVGSSATRTLARPDGGLWAYTPRSYGAAEPS